MKKEMVVAQNVAVSYPIGNLKSIGLKEYIFRKVKKQFRQTNFTALSDVSFRLAEGDMLGILGGNGAGKSTLCKVVAGILPPSAGFSKVNGNVAALLELTTGFDYEMTVKENTYLRGAILGYSKEFLDERYPEIIAFSELEDFQEFSFSQLSSGMKSRLAFSIACLIQPEIVILDEVLSVGDGAFRRKSEAKMLEVLQGGATTIFVSHSTEQVKRLCNKVLWLERGEQIAFSGDVERVCGEYEAEQGKS
jgi:ABC-2 type transport system ATP-binding protein